jgi:hypothetical protein
LLLAAHSAEGLVNLLTRRESMGEEDLTSFRFPIQQIKRGEVGTLIRRTQYGELAQTTKPYGNFRQ